MSHRLPIYIGQAQVGSVLAADAALCPVRGGAAAHTESVVLPSDAQAANAVLSDWAQALRHAGRLRAWRDELLPVSALPNDLQSPLAQLPQPLACVERGAARVLGILTHAVHLVGFASNGHIWLQQRALNKSTDPGLWDTLSGGLLAANDTLHSGVLRETYEEAGLKAEDLQDLKSCGMVLQNRMVDDGLILEAVWTYTATVRDLSAPHNLDGEAMGFDCVTHDQLRRLHAQGQVTREAALCFQTAGVL